MRNSLGIVWIPESPGFWLGHHFNHSELQVWPSPSHDAFCRNWQLGRRADREIRVSPIRQSTRRRLDLNRAFPFCTWPNFARSRSRRPGGPGPACELTTVHKNHST